MNRRVGAVVQLVDLGLGAALVVVWTLAWGELSVGNVLSGAAVAAVLLTVFPIGHDIEHVDHRLRPLAVLRLAVTLAADIVWSNLLMVRDILGGPSRERTGIVACPLRVDAPGLLTFMANVLALTPGTMPVEVTQAPPVIYLHVLRLEDPDAVRRSVARLEKRAVSALGSAAAVAACRAAPPRPPAPGEAP
jgi:multicomponent Na+:H+ antiporter subunit E